jgi:hypothetical protein
MADSPNSTLVSDFDLEGGIGEAYGASIVLAELIERKLGPKSMKREGMFQVFRLNDQEVMALHYMSGAVRGHAYDLYNGFHADESEAQS